MGKSAAGDAGGHSAALTEASLVFGLAVKSFSHRPGWFQGTQPACHPPPNRPTPVMLAGIITARDRQSDPRPLAYNGRCALGRGARGNPGSTGDHSLGWQDKNHRSVAAYAD